MEQKTIGKFITALRKANGMTQKELAEKLNVSDKTISRWERDEGSPDLSMIPVIAEIFEVTCDELLRGERKSPARRAEEASEEVKETSPKAEKQRQRLLKLTFSRYQSRTYIAMGISVVGLIAALICNLAFLKALLGFFVGTIFFVTSVICQFIFMNRAFFGVEDAELGEEELSGFKRRVISLGMKAIGLNVGFVGFTSPFLLLDAYVGLDADSMLLLGGITAAVVLLLYAIICYFLKTAFDKRGVYHLSEKEVEVYGHNQLLIRRSAGVLIILLIITFVAQQLLTNIYGPFSIMKGTTFTDYESFVTFMEQDIPYEPYYNYYGGAVREEPVMAITQVDEVEYYDEYGNVISEEEARHRTIEDAKGNVVCEYIDRNETVYSIRYSVQEDTVLPITVHTHRDLDNARAVVRGRNIMFAFGYGLEVLAVVAFYLIKRQRL